MAEAERAHAAVAAAAARGTWRQSLPRREQLPPSRLTRTTGWSLLHGHGDMVCLQPPARLHMGKQREHTQDTRPDSGCNVMYKYENETQVVTANITARTKRTLYTIRVILFTEWVIKADAKTDICQPFLHLLFSELWEPENIPLKSRLVDRAAAFLSFATTRVASVVVAHPVAVVVPLLGTVVVVLSSSRSSSPPPHAVFASSSWSNLG